MFDVVSYLMGASKAKGEVVISDTEKYTFTDDSQGNITITEEESK